MPSELEAQKARKDALLKMAISAHNQGVQEFKKDRRDARREMQGLIREQRAAHTKWRRAQQRQADEGGWLAGAAMGAGTGAAIGSYGGPGWGTAIGAGIGAIAGGIYGATQGRQAVAKAAPYVGVATQIAGSVSAAQMQGERQKELLNFYKGQDMRPGVASPGAYPGSPGSPGYPTNWVQPLTLGDKYMQNLAQSEFAFPDNTNQINYATMSKELAATVPGGTSKVQTETGDYWTPEKKKPFSLSYD